MKTLRFLRIEYLLVPTVLLGIALNQMRMVRSVNLSPWKGGGFGMFSTIDSPYSRRILCTARMEDGSYVGIDLESCVDLVSELQELRTLPTERSLERFARRVLRTSMVPLDYTNQSMVDELRIANPDFEFDAEFKRGLSELSWLRPLTSRDAVPSEGQSWIPRAIKLQIVRLCWDHEQNSVSVEPVIEPAVVRTEVAEKEESAS